MVWSLCAPHPDKDYDFNLPEFAAHAGAAILLGWLIDIPMTILRKRVVDTRIEQNRWSTPTTRKLVLYLLLAIIHLILIVFLLKALSITIPCFIQDWQFSIEGMFFPAVFFTLQSNLFTCLNSGVYDLL